MGYKNWVSDSQGVVICFAQPADKRRPQVVTLLRLSPLLPLALSNYLYGLTSVDLPSYVAGSWLGMLPGTIAYVSAGGQTVLLLSVTMLRSRWWSIWFAARMREVVSRCG